MSIKDQLTADMKQAMKDREAGKLCLSVIRMVRANIKNVEINDKKELTDDEVLAVLMKEVKMRQDSVEEFQKAGRDELVAQAKEEIAILKKYLPEALSAEGYRGRSYCCCWRYKSQGYGQGNAGSYGKNQRPCRWQTY